MEGLIGKKLGMTQLYDSKGKRVDVTVIEAGPCIVVQRKTKEKDGYDAVQVGFGPVKENRVNKPILGHFRKNQLSPLKVLAEFGIDEKDEMKVGDSLTVKIFEGVSHVDVTGITKGRGFQGVVKRHGMGGGPMTHGGHSKRRIGSVGANAWEARVYRGHRMPGHMGNTKVTIQNLSLVELRPEQNLIMVRGAIPGPAGSFVLVKKSLKKCKVVKA